MAEELGLRDIQIEEFNFDSRKLSFAVWQQYKTVRGCPVCLLEHDNPDELHQFHDDALNHGYLSSVFKDRWEERFPPEVIRSHFIHHCVLSDLVKWFQKERRKLDKGRAEVNGQKKFLLDLDRDNTELALSGNFVPLYRETVIGMMEQVRFAQAKQRQHANIDDENHDPEEAHRWHMKAIQAHEKAIKLTIAMDQQYHSKTTQAIHVYLEMLRVQLLQQVLNQTASMIKELEVELEGRIGSDAATRLLSPKVDKLRQNVEIVYREFESRAEQHGATAKLEL